MSQSSYSLLPRGKISSSFKEEGSTKRKLVKQFTAGKLSRNTSYGKNLNKLTRIRSNDSGNISDCDRPRIFRTRSNIETLKQSKLNGSSKSSINLQARKWVKNKSGMTHSEVDSDEDSMYGKRLSKYDNEDEEDDREEEEVDEEEVDSFNDGAKVVEVQNAPPEVIQKQIKELQSQISDLDLKKKTDSDASDVESNTTENDIEKSLETYIEPLNIEKHRTIQPNLQEVDITPLQKVSDNEDVRESDEIKEQENKYQLQSQKSLSSLPPQQDQHGFNYDRETKPLSTQESLTLKSKFAQANGSAVTLDDNGKSSSQLYPAGFLLSQSTGQEKPIYSHTRNQMESESITENNHPDPITSSQNKTNASIELQQNMNNGEDQFVSDTTFASNSNTSLQRNHNDSSLIFQQSGLNVSSLASQTNRPIAPPQTHQSLKRQESYLSFKPQVDHQRILDESDINQIQPLKQPALDQSDAHQTQTLKQPQHDSENISCSSSNSSSGNIQIDLSSYLSPQQPQLETRTQQKLWLQRENVATLNDIADPSDPSSQLTTSTTRLQFEQFSRDYLHIRRNANPVLESLNRVQKISGVKVCRTIQYKSSAKNISDTKTSLSKSATLVGSLGRESLELEEHFFGDLDEFNEILSKMWRKNCSEFSPNNNSVSKSKQRVQFEPAEIKQPLQQQNSSAQLQRQRHPQQQSMFKSNYHPTTRAQQQHIGKGSSTNLVNLQN